jgi:adenylate kinase family enzyme
MGRPEQDGPVLLGAHVSCTLGGGPMARVYVVGGGGSGKTTVATRLAPALDVPLVSLDGLFAPAGRAWEAERAAREAAIARLAAAPAWVVEGAYPAWAEELAGAADLVVWLDVPFRVAAWRIVRRHVLADLRRRNPYPGYRTLWRFLVGQHDYYRRTAGAYRRRLQAEAPSRWGTARYCRAHVAARAAAHRPKLLRVTGAAGGRRRGGGGDSRRPQSLTRRMSSRASSSPSVRYASRSRAQPACPCRRGRLRVWRTRACRKRWGCAGASAREDAVSIVGAL